MRSTRSRPGFLPGLALVLALVGCTPEAGRSGDRGTSPAPPTAPTTAPTAGPTRAAPRTNGTVTLAPAAGRRFVEIDRSSGADAPRGAIVADDVVVRAFARVGWGWGGVWNDPDFQHFFAA